MERGHRNGLARGRGEVRRPVVGRGLAHDLAGIRDQFHFAAINAKNVLDARPNQDLVDLSTGRENSQTSTGFDHPSIDGDERIDGVGVEVIDTAEVHHQTAMTGLDHVRDGLAKTPGVEDLVTLETDHQQLEDTHGAGFELHAIVLIDVMRSAGFEPTTFGFGGQRAIQLRHERLRDGKVNIDRVMIPPLEVE